MRSLTQEATAKPIFSLVLATIHRVVELERALASLALQDESFELIVVDQNSDDRLAAVLEPYRARFPIRHLTSRPGAARARNVGLREVTGELVGFPDDDCWYPQGLLARVARVLAADPGLSGLTGQCRDQDGRPIDPIRHRREVMVDMTNVWETHKMVNLFLRRRVVEEVGGFDETLGQGAGTRMGSGEETDFLIRALQRGHRIRHVPDLVVGHPMIMKGHGDADKVEAYGRGLGHLLRRHRFPLSKLAGYLVRSLIGVVLGVITLRPAMARFHWRSFRGKLAGYRLPVPREHVRFAVSTSAKIGPNEDGLSEYLRNVLTALAAASPADELFVYVPRNHAHLFPELVDGTHANVTVRWIHPAFNRPVLNVAWHLFIYPILLLRDRVDVVHLPEYRRPLVVAPCPTVMTVHDLVGLITNRFDPWRSIYNRGIALPLIARAGRLIAVSHNTKRDLVARLNVPEHRVTVIHNGAAARFQPRRREELPPAVLDRYDHLRPFVLCVSRIEHPNKNHVKLLRAVARFSAPVRLVLAGQLHWNHERVLAELSALSLEDRVTLLGHVPAADLPYLYNLAELVVFPSVYEGFGFPVLEAYASDVPVVSSNTSSLPELATNEDMMFDPADPDDIRRTMERFLRQPAAIEHQLGLQRRRLREFRWNEAVRLTRDALVQAIAERAGP